MEEDIVKIAHGCPYIQISEQRGVEHFGSPLDLQQFLAAIAVPCKNALGVDPPFLLPEGVEGP